MNSLKLMTVAMVCVGLFTSFADVAKATPSSLYERININPQTCPIQPVDFLDGHEMVRCAFEKGPPMYIQFHDHGVDIIPDVVHFGETGPLDRSRFGFTRSGHFGNLAQNDKKQFTIEWRVKQENGEWVPFAAIYRTTYNKSLQSGGYKLRQRLEVMKFGADHACQLGSVEAIVENHNMIARQIADKAMDENPCIEILAN